MTKFVRALLGRCACLAAGILILVPGMALAAALQDPTQPPGLESRLAAPVPERPVSLDSILYSQDRRVAIIEGEALREGQGVDGIRVIRIYENRVLVTESGRERVLYLERLPQVRGTQ
jgi:MSHA biogenesis protein MshK